MTKLSKIAGLYSSTIGSSIFGVLISIVNTKMLNADDFGSFRLLLFYILFCTTITAGGFAISTQRLLPLQCDNFKKRNTYGSTLILVSISSLILIIVTLVFATVLQYSANSSLTPLLFLATPFLWCFTLQSTLETILPATTDVFRLAILRLMPQCLYLSIACTSLYVFAIPLSLSLAIILQFSALSLTTLILYISLLPRFDNVRSSLNEVILETKSYGVHVYVGSIFNVGCAQLGPLILGLFIPTKYIGFLALAQVMVSPLILISATIGSANFSSFSGSTSIAKNTIYLAIISNCIALVLCEGMLSTIVELFYPPEYSIVSSIASILALGAVLHGSGDLLNRFLSAHGQGQTLRNITIIAGSFILIGFAIAAVCKNIWLAVGTILVGDAAYFIMLFFGYRKLTQRLATSQ